MDDKYAKEYEKQHSQSQFHTKLEEKWTKDYKDYKEDWHKEQLKNIKKPKPKPDPATVEAALRLEEELWAS
jgi:hypothetical protein